MPAARIMLIDNEAGLCRMMEAVLRDQGYQVKGYTNPVQAVADFTAGSCDLVVTDIKMPEMDGLEVLQHLRRRDPEIPVIMITAFGHIESVVVAMKNGATDYVLKTRLARLIARFVATCSQCGARIPDNQVMCSICANK